MSEVCADVAVPTFASGPEVGAALERATAGDVVLVQRRGDGRVLVCILPLEALEPPVRELLERRPSPVTLGVLRRYLLALDADGAARVIDAIRVVGPMASA
jgi:hypothetical protein